MAEKSVYLRAHLRGARWLVAVITPAGIRWRSYDREAYPTAEDALRRALAGLTAARRQPLRACWWGRLETSIQDRQSPRASIARLQKSPVFPTEDC
ncbi:hypothetical protein QUW15_02535 [Desulfovibrio piger]|nr:hypothetical protein [Desulfovibrio piger]